METELVAIFQPDGEGGWVAGVIEDGRIPEWIQDEIGSWAEDDLVGIVGTIRIERKPIGWAAALPEFENW